MVAEARMEQSEAGLVAATDGWFVVNVPDAAWVTSEYFGDACIFEGHAASRVRSGRSRRGTSCTARPGRSTSLSGRATARA